jgi:hypothetical protein
VAAARLAWKAEQPGLEPRRLVFIDETGTSTAEVDPFWWTVCRLAI